MDNFFKMISKNAKFIIIGGAALFLIWHIMFIIVNGMGDSFMPVFVSLFRIIIAATLIGGLIVFMLMGNEKAAKIDFAILGAYWMITTIVSNLQLSSAISGNAYGVYNVAAIFSFLAAITLFGALVVFFLDLLGIVSLKSIIPLIALGVIALLFIAAIFWLIYYGQANGRYNGVTPFGWESFIDEIIGGMIMPSILFSGYLYFFHEAK